MSKFLSRTLGVHKYDAHIMFALGASGMSLMARMMQGSATTLTESVL